MYDNVKISQVFLKRGMNLLLDKYVGSKAFYKKVFVLTIPIMVQNGITNFVSLIDNIMVGSVGTEQMSAVAIVNQLLFVFNLAVFGIVSGVGIFTAQYFGKGDNDGIKKTVRLKFICVAVVVAVALCIFLTAGSFLINAYLHDSDQNLNLDIAFNEAKKYLLIMLIGLVPFVVSQVYGGTLREMEQPMIPLVSGICAVAVNLVFNYLLILGKFGFPKLGVSGAAVATVMSRFVEAAVICAFVHLNKEKCSFSNGLFHRFHVPLSLAKRVLPKAIPLMANEACWALGIALLNYCYALRGLDVVAAANICSTISNLFMVTLIGFGNSIAIMVGGLLGANKIEEAKDTNNKLTFLSFVICIGITIVMVLTSELYPRMYNTTDSVKELAKAFIICYAIYMPMNSLINSFYFAIRSGGKTGITFVFDSVYMLCLTVPFTFVLAKFTALGVVTVYMASLLIEIFKVIAGILLVRNGFWARNIVDANDD